ncbi:MAG: OmpH family outer membrane protein [Deltaproteobacteria bacterium]|nr:OmpH family outer membrane protein [Deltaproteobacteria bacterium]
MRKYIACALSASIFLASITLAFAAETRIAVVDIQKIETESDAGLAAKEAFSKEVEARSKVVSAKEDSLRLLENEYLKSREGLSPQQRAEREDKLSKEARDLKRLRDDTNEDLQKKGMELHSRNIAEIVTVVKKAAEDGKYTLVMDKRQAVYAPDSIDITQKVLNMYNAVGKASGR